MKFTHCDPKIAEILSRYDLNQIWDDLGNLQQTGCWKSDGSLPEWVEKVYQYLDTTSPSRSANKVAQFTYCFIAESFMIT